MHLNARVNNLLDHANRKSHLFVLRNVNTIMNRRFCCVHAISISGRIVKTPIINNSHTVQRRQGQGSLMTYSGDCNWIYLQTRKCLPASRGTAPFAVQSTRSNSPNWSEFGCRCNTYLSWLKIRGRLLRAYSEPFRLKYLMCNARLAA